MEFGLGPLRSIDPELLLTGDDDVDGFVLALALAFNDIKTIHWMNFLLLKHQPANLEEISPEVGQWQGMRVQASRWLMGLSHEIVHAIARAHEQKVLRKPLIRAVLKSLPSGAQQRWKDLVAFSTGPSGVGAALRPYLRNLRNDGVFHYDQPTRLLQAYRAFFLDDATRPHNEQAYYSVGPNLRQTRFFFADAAAQRMYSGESTLEEKFNQTDEFLRELHHALFYFLWEFVKRRAIHGRENTPIATDSGDSPQKSRGPDAE